MRRANDTAREGTNGFTLIELLAATGIIGTLLCALSAVAMTAFDLRGNAQDALEISLKREAVTDLLTRDLELMVAPTGIFGGAILGESGEEAGGLRWDTLEFSSASGVLTDREPWAAVQEVAYYLSESEDDAAESECDLIRTTNRNLLPATEEEPQEVVILRHVQSLTFSYYDGETWQDTWDSTLVDNEAPRAVYVRIETASDSPGKGSDRPIEVMCEVVSRSISSSGDSAEDASGEEASEEVS
jgi:prepilin-type N-terminal cleavage/methylation domain-containing protein